MDKTTHNTITATELVKNLSAVLDKVRISGRSLCITKGSQTVARITPPPKYGIAIAELSEFLRPLLTRGDGAKLMQADLKYLRDQANLPDNSWG